MGRILELSVPSVSCDSTKVDVCGVGTFGAWAWWSFFRNMGADSRDGSGGKRVERVTGSFWRVCVGALEPSASRPVRRGKWKGAAVPSCPWGGAWHNLG